MIEKKIISASRRVEMLGFFPDQLMSFLKKRLPPEKVHTIVFWSKNPQTLITYPELRKTIKCYDQCYLHFTISGMGGTYLEPGIPSTIKSLELLPDLIDLLEDPDRICIRFDPIVHFKLPDGTTYSNLDLFPLIVKAARKTGVETFKVSWMENYPKVDRRLRKYEILPIPPRNRNSEADWILKQARSCHIKCTGCCVSGWPISRCIDGEQLTRLHSQKINAPLEKANGQRSLCGCTKSWDIGWYYACPGKCLYCYANPANQTKLQGIHPQKEKDTLMKIFQNSQANL